jgi:hypothetical protein
MQRTGGEAGAARQRRGGEGGGQRDVSPQHRHVTVAIGANPSAKIISESFDVHCFYFTGPAIITLDIEGSKLKLVSGTPAVATLVFLVQTILRLTDSEVAKIEADPFSQGQGSFNIIQGDLKLGDKRNLVERFFNKIKHYRCAATRDDKRADNFLAGVKLASIRIRLRANEAMG